MGRGDVTRRQQLIWLGLILLTAVFLRLWQIDQLPPGLTHDEADHGITAWSIVNGERGVYFTVGYGREPLYDYATAIVMQVLGPTYLAGRLTAVFFSILTLVFLYLWVKRAFDTPTALLTVAGFAVGFWSVMSGRQALRSVTLGAFFVGGLWLYLCAIFPIIRGQYLAIGHHSSASHTQSPVTQSPNYLLPTLSGLLLGLAFYTYIPARAMWFVIPAGLVYLLLLDRRKLLLIWKETAVTLIVSLFVAAPLFSYLRANPQSEVRIQELILPLTTARQGDLAPLIDHSLASLRLFFIEGDTAWRYNIAGQPFLPIWFAPFLLLGFGMMSWWAIRPFFQKDSQTVWRGYAAWIVLVWLGLGFAPVLVTGPELATTQAIGVQPVLYLLVAVGLMGIGDWGLRIGDQRIAYSLQLIAIVLFIFTAFITFRDYQRWGAHPEVRVQYESTMFIAMDYVNQNLAETAVTVSTITPSQYHTPALAQMTLTSDVQPRWFNASGGLIIPNSAQSTLIVPGFTPIHEGLKDYLETAVLNETLPLQETDLDRPLDFYELNIDKLLQDWETDFQGVEASIQLNNNLQLLGYDIQSAENSVGNQLNVATLWQIQAPISSSTQLFTHLLGEDGVPLGQHDRLDAPSESWQVGDYLIQLHQIDITERMVGKRPLSIGGYTCQNACDSIVPLILFVDDAQMHSYVIGEVEVIP
ncbi:MAG: hypothetical protein AAF490_01880 [Chloroflexota bacterium]